MNLKPNTQKWLAFLFLFLGIALSFVAMFQGSWIWLVVAVLFLGLGVWFLKQWMSGSQRF